MKRLFGIVVVWMGCAIGWVILGSTLVARTGESSASLSPEVHQLWGPPLEQEQPSAHYTDTRMVQSTQRVSDANGERLVTTEEPQSVNVPVALVGSDLEVALDLEHRRRGLVWFPTYGVDFVGRYTFQSPSDEGREVTFLFPLQGNNVVYDGLRVEDEAGHVIPSSIGSEPAPGGATRTQPWPTSETYDPQERFTGSAHWTVRLEPGQRKSFTVRYRTRGTESWRYRMGTGTTRVSDFRLALRTDFDGVDFPAGTLSPSRHAVENGNWRGTWQFESLVSSQPIGVTLPARLNPGPLATRITFFAPVGLLFFFFVVAVLGTARKQRHTEQGAETQELHPMHFFFLGCAFFAFHLLFAYLVDHLSIPVSFSLSAAVSTILVVSYARLFIGWTFALREIGLSQLVYLVLFSLTFLFEGFTGLAITVGAILTLFVMMQITGRTVWGAKKEPSPGPQAPSPSSTQSSTQSGVAHAGEARSSIPQVF